MTEETVFQRLVADDAVESMVNDLEDLDGDEDARWELALEFGPDDVPYIIYELEEMDDGG